MAFVLLVDDDTMLTEPLARALREAGFEVEVAYDGPAGLQAALSRAPDVVVLDVMLPGMDGWDVCREIRAASVVPILMLTAMGSEVDRVLGLELGADDYLTKPFSTRELVARLRALLRRVEIDHEAARDTGLLEVGELSLEPRLREARKGDSLLNLRYKEFELLSLLMSRAGEVVSRAELFDRIWGTDWLGDTRTLDVHVRWLRQKIEDDPGAPRYLQTVRGVGYRLVAPGGN